MPITEARRKTNEKWRKAHPIEFKKSLTKAQKDYYEKNKEKILEKKKAYYLKKKLLKEQPEPELEPVD